MNFLNLFQLKHDVLVLPDSIMISGDTVIDTDCRIHGVVKGTLSASKKLIISKEAVIEGIIYANEIVVAGKVMGTIHATRHVQIAQSAHITGKIHSPLVEVEEGTSIEQVYTEQYAQSSNQRDNEEHWF